MSLLSYRASSRAKLDYLETRLRDVNDDRCHAYADAEWIAAERARVEEQIRQMHCYQRPIGRLASLLNTWLGPLPEDMQYVDPALQSEVKGQWSRRVLALLTLAGAVTMVLTLSRLFPWLLISPFTLISDGTTWLLGGTWGWITAVAVSGALLWFLGPVSVKQSPYQEKILDRFAMEEELHFRTGAESWSMWRRAYSCVAFGLLHVTNIIYPGASLIVVGVAGVVFMVVYLREYRRTGSTQHATLASARLHATYNRFALAFLAVCIVANVAATL